MPEGERRLVLAECAFGVADVREVGMTQEVSQLDAADRDRLEGLGILGIGVGNVYIGRSRVMTRLKELVKQFEEVA